MKIALSPNGVYAARVFGAGFAAFAFAGFALDPFFPAFGLIIGLLVFRADHRYRVEGGEGATLNPIAAVQRRKFWIRLAVLTVLYLIFAWFYRSEGQLEISPAQWIVSMMSAIAVTDGVYRFGWNVKRWYEQDGV